MPGRALSVAACLLLCLSQPAAAHEVGLELVLAIDCSLSVSDPEYSLQMGGIVAALRDTRSPCSHSEQPGGVALTVMQWAGTAKTRPAVPWRLLATHDVVSGLAIRPGAAPRPPLSYYTAIGHADAAGVRRSPTRFLEGREKIDIPATCRSTGPPPGVVKRRRSRGKIHHRRACHPDRRCRPCRILCRRGQRVVRRLHRLGDSYRDPLPPSPASSIAIAAADGMARRRACHGWTMKGAQSRRTGDRAAAFPSRRRRRGFGSISSSSLGVRCIRQRR